MTVASTKPRAKVNAVPCAGHAVPWAWPWNSANSPIIAALKAIDGRSANAISAPSTITDPAMPISTQGSATPATPSAKPAAITTGNVAGSSQSAGRPSCEAHRPTATIASTWSSAVERMRQAVAEAAGMAADVGERRMAEGAGRDSGETTSKARRAGRMVFLMAERRRSAGSQFIADRRTLSIHLDEHRAALDRGRIGLHRDHAGRRHHLAGLDVELAVVEVALDHVAVDVALRQRAGAVGAGVVGDVELCRPC